MTHLSQRGTTLVVGLILLSVVTLLGLAGASSAHIERQLAQDEQFRENAVSAASAGIELSISRIVTTPDPATVPASASSPMPGAAATFETVTRFTGYENALPQDAGAKLAGAHFEITSAGRSARHAVDRQRVGVMLVVDAPGIVAPAPCGAAAGDAHCFQRGELVRLSWQRLPAN